MAMFHSYVHLPDDISIHTPDCASKSCLEHEWLRGLPSWSCVIWLVISTLPGSKYKMFENVETTNQCISFGRKQMDFGVAEKNHKMQKLAAGSLPYVLLVSAAPTHG